MMQRSGPRQIGRRLALMLVPILAAMAQPAQADESAVGDGPRRVVSTNLCADQLALMLLPRDRIAGVSTLAGDPALSNVADRVAGLPRHRSGAEEVLALRPDFVLSGTFRERKLNEHLARRGIAHLPVPSPETLDGMIALIRQVGTALNRTAEAEALIAPLTARLEALRGRLTGLRLLVWSPNGYTSGKTSVTGTMIEFLGATNLGAVAGIRRGGTLPLERIAELRPDILVLNDHMDAKTSRAQALMIHPALPRLSPGMRSVAVPTRAWICPGPWLADAAERLVAGIE